jgi:hypothetical protein
VVSGEWTAGAKAGGAGVGFKAGAEGGGGVMVIFRTVRFVVADFQLAGGDAAHLQK